jgi:hypothetical protein
VNFSVGPVRLEVGGNGVEFGFDGVEVGFDSVELGFDSVELGGRTIPFGLYFTQFCRYMIELVFKAIHTCVHSRFNAIEFFCQHLMALNDNVQFMLEMFGLDSNLMAELGLYFFFEIKDDLFETFEIVTIHNWYLRLTPASAMIKVLLLTDLLKVHQFLDP